jgi:hypothetical protein
VNALDTHLLRAYLDGELDADATQAFEILLLQRDDLASIVEADTALRLGLADVEGATKESVAVATDLPAIRPIATGSLVDEDEQPTVPVSGTQGPRGANPRGVSSRNRRMLRLVPLAAAAVILVSIGFGLGMNRGSVPLPLALAKAVQIEKVRGIGGIQSISLPESGYVVMYVDASGSANCSPRIALKQGGRSLFEQQANLDELGFAWLVVPRAALSAGEATVFVTCGDSMQTDYRIELTRK